MFGFFFYAFRGKNMVIMLSKMRLISFVIFSMVACSVNKANDGLPGLKTDDCYKDRKTVSSVVDVDAKLSMISDQWVMIPINDETQRYGACNMVEFAFKEGDEVTFTADVKEIAPNERWAFSPCVLKKFETRK